MITENNNLEQDNKKKKTRSLLIAVIGVLVAINMGLLYMYFKKNKEAQKVETTLTKENTELNTGLAEANALLQQYKDDSVVLAANNVTLSDELISKKNEIASLVSQIKNRGNATPAELSSLRKKVGELQSQIGQLQQENSVLKETNTVLTEDKSKLEGEKQVLQEEKVAVSKERDQYLSAAQKLQVTNINIETTKKRWIDKKEVKTDKASDVDNVKIGFGFAENLLATSGERVLYVKITNPNGVTVVNPGADGGTFTYDGSKESKYTYKLSVDFNKEAKAGPSTIWRPKDKLVKGKYYVEFYTDGYKLGGSNFTLK